MEPLKGSGKGEGHIGGCQMQRGAVQLIQGGLEGYAQLAHRSRGCIGGTPMNT